MDYFRKGRYPEAIIQFQNAVQIDNRFADAHYQLAQCYLRQAEWLQAQIELLTTVELDSRNSQAQLELGRFMVQGGQFQRAKERAQLVLKDNPANVKAQILLATSDAELGNLQDAVGEAGQAVSTAPNDAAPYLTLGIIHEKLGQLDDAEQDFQRAVSLEPASLASHMSLGNFYQRRRNWADAETQYRAASAAVPKSLAPWTALTSLYVLWGKKDLAEQNLQNAKKMMPEQPEGYRLLGEFYLATGDFAKAAAEFASLCQQHPKDLFVRKRYIELLIRDKQLEPASKLNEAILRENSRDTDALVSKGQILNLQQKSAEAIPILESAVHNTPANALGHLELGVSYASIGNPALAEREFREALKQNPSLLKAKEDLTRVAFLKGDIKLLDQSSNDWLKAVPAAPQAHVFRGIARLRKGDAPGAELDFQAALKGSPKNPAAYAGLGDLRLLQKRLPEAEKFYEQALTLDPRSTEALQGLIGVFLIQKQPEKAVRLAQAQVAKFPDSGADHLLLAKALLANQKNAEARIVVEKSITLDNGDWGAVFLLAQLQGMSGEDAAAAANYERIIQQKPQDAEAYLALGLLHEKHGDWQKAEQIYGKAHEVEPDQPAIANNLSYLLLEHGGDLGYAVTLAQTARKGMPDSPNAADTLGCAFYKIGVFDSAVTLLQEATKKAPKNPTYFYHLGLASQKTKKLELAKGSFQRVLQLDPKFPHAEEIRQALAELDVAK
jgi:tetratricopeptide (TPR) repeat protein